jgi:hypothetical protein
MSADNDGIAADDIVARDHIPNRISYGPQPQIDQFFAELSRPRCLPEWRGRYHRQADLVRFYIRFVIGNIPKGSLDPFIRENVVDVLAHYLISNVTGSDSISG